MLDERDDLEAAGGPASGPACEPGAGARAAAPRDIWTLRDLLLFIAFIPFALLAANLVALTGYAALRPFTGWPAGPAALRSNTFFLLALQILFYLFVLGFLYLVSKLRHPQPFWQSLGWKKPAGREAAKWLLGGCALAMAANLALLLRPDTTDFPLEHLFNSRGASYALGGFAIGIAPVIEEVVFRGLLFAVCERAAGWRFAVVITALLFAGLHVPEYWDAWNHVWVILGVGMVFSLARGLSGALTPSIFLHIGYNSLMMAGLFLSSHHFRALN